MPKKKATPASWKPGTSGNPGGRLKTPDEVRQAYREASPLALETLLKILTLWEVEPGAAKAAATEINDRAWGKAPSAPEDREAASEGASATRDALAAASTSKILEALGAVETKSE